MFGFNRVIEAQQGYHGIRRFLNKNTVCFVYASNKPALVADALDLRLSQVTAPQRIKVQVSETAPHSRRTYLQRRAVFEAGHPVEEIVVCLVAINPIFLPELFKFLDRSVAARGPRLSYS